MLFFVYWENVFISFLFIMERKTDHFFDGEKLNMNKLLTQIQQHPQNLEEIINFVVKKVQHFTEFWTKKQYLKDRYDHKLQELYAEYMQEE